MNLLVIQSGLFGEHSVSNQLADRVVAELQKSKAVNVVVRDLVAEPLPYLDGFVASALNSAPEQRDSAQQALVELSDRLIAEVEQADAIVLGLPMYNFGIPAQLKSWFDLLARAGKTFRYTETGPQGLLTDKPVFIAAARGGLHAGQVSDSQTPFVRTLLAFLGLKDVRFVYAEGLSMGPDAKDQALQQFDEALASATAGA